jgi:hypothetical protein
MAGREPPLDSAACWTILEIVFVGQKASLRPLDKTSHWNRNAGASLPGPPF